MKTIVQKTKQNLKSAHDRQKSFADLKRTHVKFKVGDQIYIKVRPRNNTLKLGKSTKLAPWYCRPFQVLTRVGLVAYQLELPANLKVYNVFHVSMLRKYVHHVTHIVNWNVIQVEPLRILDKKETMLQR